MFSPSLTVKSGAMRSAFTGAAPRSQAVARDAWRGTGDELDSEGVENEPKNVYSQALAPRKKSNVQLCPLGHGPLTERKFGSSEAFLCPVCQPVPNPSKSG